MTLQSDTIAAILSARPAGDIHAWLDRLAVALDAAASLEAATIADLVARARPHWGVKSAAEAADYIGFWSSLTARHDDPALRGAYADVLFLLGPPDRRREALDLYLAAARRDPEVFIAYAGDFGDLATELDARKDFEVVKIAFYARRVDQGEMEETELRDAVRDLLAEYRDDASLRDQLRAIAHRSLGG
jgi:hypothetical protein